MFGLLGAGNIGNDASMEAFLQYLHREHPGASVDVMTTDPADLSARYGLPARGMDWVHPLVGRGPRPLSLGLTLLAKLDQVVRTARWVRRHDVVVVPGMGVLETSLPLRPWEAPWGLFLLGLSGRLVRTPVALVSVGADRSEKRATRWLLDAAARTASYVSYRDEQSRAAMRERGVSVTRSPVYPDLVFGLTTKTFEGSRAGRTVGLGVMAYRGGNDDRDRAESLHEEYVTAMRALVLRLLDEGYRIVLFVGDRADEPVAASLVDHARARRPDLDAGAVVAECADSFEDLTRVMSAADVVVATRFHNVICALKLATPTLSLEYASKSSALMTDLGLGDFCHSARHIDVDELMGQIVELERRGPELRAHIVGRLAEKQRLLGEQYEQISAELFRL